MLYEHVRDTFVILTELHIGDIYRIHLMIEPNRSTQFILYVFYGVHDWGLSRPMQDVDVILSMTVLIFTRCVRPCIVMLENVRSAILLND